MKVDFNINEGEIAQSLMHFAKSKCETIMRDMIIAHFRSPGYGYSEGIGYTIIKQKIDDMLMSDEFQKKIEYHINKEFDKILEETTKRALDHSIRKQVFPTIQNAFKDES